MTGVLGDMVDRLLGRTTWEPDDDEPTTRFHIITDPTRPDRLGTLWHTGNDGVTRQISPPPIRPTTFADVKRHIQETRP